MDRWEKDAMRSSFQPGGQKAPRVSSRTPGHGNPSTKKTEQGSQLGSLNMHENAAGVSEGQETREGSKRSLTCPQQYDLIVQR